MTEFGTFSTGVDVWSSDTWRTEAGAWVDRKLSAAGIVRSDDVEQTRIRPWGTLLRVQTDAGMYWLKATAPGTAFEVAIYPALVQAAPDLVLESLATDGERGWVLLPDGGAHLSDVVDGPELVSAMCVVVQRYADLQRRLAPKAESLIRLGVEDMRPATLKRRFDEALLIAGEYAERQGEDERRAIASIAARRSAFESWCDRLAASRGVAES